MARRAMLIRLEDDLHKELHDGAYKEHTSMNALVARAIRAYFDAAKSEEGGT